MLMKIQRPIYFLLCLQQKDNVAGGTFYLTEKFLQILCESNLSQHPGTGRPGKYPQTRELVIAGTPYIVPYQITGEGISIIRVLHGAMKWQK